MNEQTSRSNTPPFKTLGTHLKYLREQFKETTQEASAAVEIEVEMLNRIEAGLERPSEDILLLLIQHYNMQDQEAVQLWELAGYDSDNSPHKLWLDELTNSANKQMIMVLAMDVRTMYSDGVDININQAGMTLNFTQTSGPNRRTSVGKIGMSYEQAAQVLNTLQHALLKAQYLKGPRGLPAPKPEDPPVT